jgi:type I restriction enzyme M protein
MCEVMQPTPQDRICDPAAGTGGFLCNAYQYVLDRFENQLDRDEKRALQENLVEGVELSSKVGRMCASWQLRSRTISRRRSSSSLR